MPNGFLFEDVENSKRNAKALLRTEGLTVVVVALINGLQDVHTLPAFKNAHFVPCIHDQDANDNEAADGAHF